MKKKMLFKVNAFIWLFAFVLISSSVKGQSSIEISGKVMDANNEPINEAIVNSSTGKSVTGEDGTFVSKVITLNDFITIEKDGFETLQIPAKLVSSKNDITLVAKNSDQSIPLLNRSKTKNQITGAVSYLKGEEMENIAGTNRMNSLSGKISGLWVNQLNGMTGEESTSMKIRGQKSFGIGRGGPTVLIDGVQSETGQIDPYDIESVTVLKDAASAVMYGLRSANGVILINTKRGQAGNIRINVNSQASMVEPLRMPKFLDAYNYATLYNEATKNDGSPIKYTQEDLDAFQNGSNKFTHPNLNWSDEALKKYSLQTRNNVNISGGTKMATYYFSMGYVTNNGLFNTDDAANTYNTNSSFALPKVTTKVDIQVNDRLKIQVDLQGQQDQRNNPGLYSDSYENSILSTIYGTPPQAHPISNEDGSLAGTADYTKNLYGQLNKSGYSLWKKTSVFAKTRMDYDMSFITKGLSLVGMFAYNNFNVKTIDRSKTFAVYQGTVVNKIGLDTQMESKDVFGDNTRYSSGEIGLQYNKEIGRHNLKTLFMVNQQVDSRRSTKLPRVYQGMNGFFSYSNNNKYLADFTFAVQGSEQFPEENRYGFFPAVSLGWVISEENFLRNSSTINLLKLRGSAGITGNDFDPYASGNPYFAYLENYSETGSYPFGTTLSQGGGFQEIGMANNAITWEKTHKYNVGLDAAFFHNVLLITADGFYEKTNDILIEGANPKFFGTDFWYPAGVAENKGIDGMVTLQKTRGKFNFHLSANATIVKNKILDQSEESRAYDWMVRTGNPIGTKFGYVFDRYFTEEDNINSLPNQTQLGKVQAGDLKYKDLNGDLVIDDNDMTMIGKSGTPELFYGLSTGFSFAGLDVSVQFQGISGIDKFSRGDLTYEFLNGKGNVNERHLGRWVPGAGQSATYPRLSIVSAQNNRVTSNYWLKDASYLRLKTVEVGYTIPKNLTKKLSISRMRIYTSGYNLFTWDHIDTIDPEDSFGFPISRYLTAGLNLSF